MKTSIKLCGFKYIEDIIFATSLNINYLGMIFVKNVQRTVNLDTAVQGAKICKDKGIKSVGVFLNQDLSEIEKILSKVDLDMLQLHGTENIDDYKVFNKDIIKTLHISEELPLKVKDLDFDNVTYLLDTSSNHLQGGTGKCFDWSILKDIPVEKLFVAGGLKPDNILDLLSSYEPKCVDVSSGIEKESGHKDHNLMSEFVHKVRAY
jgi:phosphoribosylanthranilate isomerase